MNTPDFSAEGKALLAELTEIRHDLHSNPEVGLVLPRTQQRVLEILEPLGLEITLGEQLSSVVAVLRGEKRPANGEHVPTVLLRGDMDALPVEEQTGLEFASTNGMMHACGHDLHTTSLIGAAQMLAAHRSELPGDVVFMFQPGEEGDGGAEIMIKEGLLNASGQLPDAAYAIHVSPGPLGFLGTRPGPMAAGSNRLFITVTGRGGHGSQPHLVRDPVPVLAEIVLALQTFVTRRFSAFDPIILSVTQLNASQAINVIPEKASLAATIRTLSEASLQQVLSEIPEVARGIAQAHGCDAETDVHVLYPVTINDPETTAESVQWLREEFGDERVHILPTPQMGSEDFAFVANEIPATFIGMGASPRNLDLAHAEFNHSPRAIFDDAVLGDEAATLAYLAWKKILSLAETPAS